MTRHRLHNHHVRSKQKTLLVALACLGALSLTAGFAVPASAAGAPSLAVHLTETDGTAPYSSTDGAGLDASASNGIVRVNDTVTYNVEVAVNDVAAQNTSFSIVLPQGQSIERLPAYCRAGSSISPATMPGAPVPITATSYQKLPVQTVKCILGSRSAASTLTYPLTAKVSNQIPNAHRMGPVAATATADGVEAPAESEQVSTVASARLTWDLSKNGEGAKANSGEVSGPRDVACPQDAGAQCAQFIFPLTIASPVGGGKGAAPATSPFTLTEAIDARSLFPKLTAQQIAAIAANPTKYGTTINCNPMKLDSIPARSGGGSTTNVRESGRMSCTQPGGPGTAVDLTLVGTDTSLTTYPSMNRNGSSIPAGQAYIVATTIAVNVPTALITEFGTATGGISTIDYTNRYTNLVVTGIDGAVQTSADQPTANDSRSGTFADKAPAVGPPSAGPGISATKVFAGDPGTANNTGARNYANSDYINTTALSGPPGGWSAHSGQIQVGDGQTVTSVLEVGDRKSQSATAGSAIVCDVWDPTKIQLQAKHYQSDGPRTGQSLAPDAATPVWLSGYLHGGTSAKPGNVNGLKLPEYSVAYSAGEFGSDQKSACGVGDWFSDPSQVDGNDPNLAAQGIYTAVNRVRIWTPLAPLAVGTTGELATFSIGMRVVPALTEGTVIPNFASYVASNGSVASEKTMLESIINGPAKWSVSSYTPGTSVTNGNTGILGDRLISAPYYSRMSKLVQGPDQKGFTSTPPSTTSGDSVKYRLQPTLNSTAPGNTTSTRMWVEDCIPAGLNFDSATLEPSRLSINSTPGDAKIAPCKPRDTYVRWDLGQRVPNVPIEPIIVTTTVSTVLLSGTYNNTAVVSADGDRSSVAKRSASVQIKVESPTGIALDKRALTPRLQVNRAGQAVNELASWEILLLNNNAANTLSNVDIIDVLPKDGVGGTSHHGSLVFTEARVLTGGATIQYTSSVSPEQDPKDASNGATGTTAWCSSPAGGAVVSGLGGCPATADEVTGLRIVRAGPFASGDLIQTQVDMTAIGDRTGDVFVDSTAARVLGQKLLVGPATAAETVIGSTIGNLVWLDSMKTGIQGASSVGVAGFPVSIAGTDSLGNAVSAHTATDANGHYLFSDLRAGEYTVTFESSGLSTGQQFSVKSAGADRALDSDGNQISGVTSPITISPGTENLSIDQGITVTASAAPPVVPPVDPQPPVVPPVTPPATPVTPVVPPVTPSVPGTTAVPPTAVVAKTVTPEPVLLAFTGIDAVGPLLLGGGFLLLGTLIAFATVFTRRRRMNADHLNE